MAEAEKPEWDRLDWMLYGLWEARRSQPRTNHSEVAFLRSIYQMGVDDTKQPKIKE